MEIIKYLAFKKLNNIAFTCLVLAVLAGCSFPKQNSGSAIWFDKILVTTGVDEDRNPVDSISEVEYGIDEVICYMSIRGPNGFTLPVAWYHEDKLLYSTTIVFGNDGIGEAHFLKNRERDPLPSGKYRCEWGPVGSPLRTVEFTILPSSSL